MWWLGVYAPAVAVAVSAAIGEAPGMPPVVAAAREVALAAAAQVGFVAARPDASVRANPASFSYHCPIARDYG